MKEKYWWLNDESQAMLERGYLTPGQDVKSKVELIAKYAASFYKDEEGLKERFQEVIERGWCSLSSPIWANFGEDRGLPIACFGSHVADSMENIYETLYEVAMQTKLGGGTSGYFGNLRPVGSPLRGGGVTSGVMSFISLFDNTAKVVSQAGVRRGAFAAYLDIDSPEIDKFLTIKDKDSEFQSINTGVCVSDVWMKSMEEGDKEKREIWAKVLRSRREKGIPYIFFKDTVNKHKPQIYKDTNSVINHSNLCIVGSDRVLTQHGYLTASELYKMGGELVLFNGSEKVRSTPMLLRETQADVYKVTLSNGMEQTVTLNHGMAVLKNKKIIRTELKDLKIGDKIAIQIQKGIFGDESNEDMAYLLGLYQSDGTQYKDKRFIDIWENDFDLLPEIQEAFDNVYTSLGGGVYKVKNQYGETSGNRIIETPVFREQFSNSVRKMRLGTNVLSKIDFNKGYIPEWIWRSNEKTQWKYVKGLLEADGTVSKSSSKGNPIQISYAEINLNFLKELQILFNNLGLNSSIRILREKGENLLPDGKGGYKLYKTKTCYRLTVSNKNDALVIEKNTGFLTRKKVFIEDRKYRDNSKKSAKVVSIEYVGKEDVFCPTIFNTEHIFVSNGVKTFNCSEIFLPNSEFESFVCCLMSMNLALYDEWKDTDAVEVAVMLLDAVMSDFIKKVKNIPSMKKAYNFAVRHRALGLGVLGWHSLLQKNRIPFESFEAQQLNVRIFSHIKDKAYSKSIELGEKYGFAPIFDEGETTDVKRRNTTLIAIAPTTSSSSILGQTSPGIEPYASNLFVAGLAKGSFTRRNEYLEELLEEKDKNTEDVWNSITINKGSVQHLDFLSEDEKSIFKTFVELSPLSIIQQASARQYYIDQGQSVNLRIPHVMSIKDVNKIHMEAWKLGLKSLYYQRGTSVAKEEALAMMNCKSCEA